MGGRFRRLPRRNYELSVAAGHIVTGGECLKKFFGINCDGSLHREEKGSEAKGPRRSFEFILATILRPCPHLPG